MLHGGSMKKSILLLSVLFCFISCEDEQKDDTAIRAGEELNVGDNRLLNDDEYKIAQDICSALEEKNIEIQRMVGFSKKFSFSRSKKYCGGSSFDLASFRVSLSAPTSFGEIPKFKSSSDSNSDTDDFVYNVFVEIDPVIKLVCDKVLNQGKKPNIIEPYGKYQVKYRFFGRDDLELALYINDDGKWMPYRFDIFNVNLNESSERYGMIMDRYAGAYCRSNLNDISYIRQTLL